MSSSPSKYHELIYNAVVSADNADLSSAVEFLRAALSLRFDGKIASSLDLIHAQNARAPGKAIDLRSMLRELYVEPELPAPEPAPEEPSPVSNPTAQHMAVGSQGMDTQATAQTSAIAGPADPEDLVDQARDLYLSGSLESALDLIEVANKSVISEEGKRLREAIRASCIQRYMADLSPLERVVTPAVARGEWRNLRLNAQRTFLLSQADGIATIADLIDLSGLAELDALRTIKWMIDEGILDIS